MAVLPPSGGDAVAYECVHRLGCLDRLAPRTIGRIEARRARMRRA
jgi:hypothetical protein